MVVRNNLELMHSRLTKAACKGSLFHLKTSVCFSQFELPSKNYSRTLDESFNRERTITVRAHVSAPDRRLFGTDVRRNTFDAHAQKRYQI